MLIDGEDRLCLAQISNTLLKQFSYNEIHNRRVALGITCVQCTPVQLEILRRAGAMPISSRRCGMISKREAERLCRSFLTEIPPPQLPENFAFNVKHRCAWGCRGSFIPSRYNSSRAKCIKCQACGAFYSPNKFIFHSHRNPDVAYVQPDAANFNSWRRHLFIEDEAPNEDVSQAWEDVKAMFNGGSRKRSNGTNFDDGPKEKAKKFNSTLAKAPIISAASATPPPPTCMPPYRSSISIFNQGPSFPLLPYPVPPFLTNPFPTAALYASLLERERMISEAKISDVMQELE